jgi:hypothetical protein
MMKKITIIMNGICFALALITVLKGAGTSLVAVLIYGMSLGAVLTHQKKTFYYTTLALNGTLLVVGLSLIFYESSRVIKSLNQEYLILIALFLMLLLTPLLNLIFIKTKMIVLNRMSLRNNQLKSSNSFNNKKQDTTLKWPDTTDGDVFRRMEANGFDFSIEHEIDFNVNFDNWPPSQAVLDIIYELYPNAKTNEPDSEYDGDVSFIVNALLDYEMVIRVQNEVTKAVAPYGGVCESWGVWQG